MSDENVRDGSLKVTKALPAASTSATTGNLDTGKADSQGAQPPNVELLLTAPALTTGQLKDADTMTYDILHGDTTSPTTKLFGSPLIQTGAGGVGAAADTYRFKLPSDAKRYVAAKATNSGTNSASASNFSLEMLF